MWNRAEAIGNTRHPLTGKRLMVTSAGATEKENSPWLSVDEVADRFGVTPRTVRNWRTRGMPAHRRGGVLRFHRDEADEWFRQEDGAEAVG